MKVLLLAFGNPDNVLSLSRHLSDQVNLTLLFAVSGDRFRQGVADANLENLPYGLCTDQRITKEVFGGEIKNYIGDRFDVWFLKTPSRRFLFRKGGFRNYRIIRKASSVITGSGFDAVHFNGTSGFLLYLIRHIKCRNRFWTLHDYRPHTGEENPSGDFLNRLYTKSGLRFVQHYKYLSGEFAKHFGVDEKRVSQVYSGAFDVYRSFKQKKVDVPGKYILFFGRFSKYKGIDVLVDAFRKAGKELKDTGLVLAGSGHPGCTINTDEGITLINRYIEPSELSYLVSNALFVVTPYTDSTHSGVIMTSYAYDKPVVSSDVGGIREVVADKETGLLFSPDNSGELAECILKLCRDEGLLESMSSKIRKMKEEGILNWDGIAQKMRDIYSENVI